MRTNTGKLWLVGFLIAIGSFVVTSLVFNIPILAQGEFEKSGEVGGGKSDSIPIQLMVGEMVQGEIVAVRNQRLRLSISDFSGNSIYNFGETSTRGGFYYAAEIDGQHYLVVTNPDGLSVGTRGYQLTYYITPTDLMPGTGSGQKVSKDVAKSDIPWTIIWWVGGIIIVLGLFLRIFMSGTRRTRRYRSIQHYEDLDYDEPGRSDIFIHQRTVRCDRCNGTGRVQSLYLPGTVKCDNCDGTGRVYD